MPSLSRLVVRDQPTQRPLQPVQEGAQRGSTPQPSLQSEPLTIGPLALMLLAEEYLTTGQMSPYEYDQARRFGNQQVRRHG